MNTWGGGRGRGSRATRLRAGKGKELLANAERNNNTVRGCAAVHRAHMASQPTRTAVAAAVGRPLPPPAAHRAEGQDASDEDGEGGVHVPRLLRHLAGDLVSAHRVLLGGGVGVRGVAWVTWEHPTSWPWADQLAGPKGSQRPAAWTPPYQLDAREGLQQGAPRGRASCSQSMTPRSRGARRRRTRGRPGRTACRMAPHRCCAGPTPAPVGECPGGGVEGAKHGRACYPGA